jgi:trehalose 6-phosphate synthase/phosphatase
MDQYTETATRFLDREACVSLFFDYRRAAKRLLLLDYDGSLTPFTDVPSEASPADNVLDILRSLSSYPANEVYIISGRDGVTLEKWLKDIDLNIIAEHGAAFRKNQQPWGHLLNELPVAWKEDIRELMRAYANRCPGSFIEEKNYSLAWHYRRSDEAGGRQQALQLMAELGEAATANSLDILDGNKVVELRNKGINKGVAAEYILKSGNFDFVLAIGDDKTDEDMFRQLSDVPGAYTIKVGHEPSCAKCNVDSPFMVHDLLEELVKLK